MGAFPELDAGSWQVSTDAGRDPRWSSDGEELFYITYLRGGTRVVPVEAGDVPTFGNPQQLFETTSFGYDFAPREDRFLMIVPFVGRIGDPLQARQINVVLNWFQELERLVPTN